MRVRCKRFPPIEKDMKMVLAHCGSLFLDPRSLAEARGPAAPRTARKGETVPPNARRLPRGGVRLRSSPSMSVCAFVVCVAQVYHEMVVLEHLHTRAEFSVGTTVEAISKPALEMF